MSVYRKGDAHRRSHSIPQKVGCAGEDKEVSRHSAEDQYWQNSDACVGTLAQQFKRERDGTRVVLPRTTTTSVVLNASADYAVVESRRREDRTAFSERQV